jgi:hypothetical protein
MFLTADSWQSERKATPNRKKVMSSDSEFSGDDFIDEDDEFAGDSNDEEEVSAERPLTPKSPASKTSTTKPSVLSVVDIESDNEKAPASQVGVEVVRFWFFVVIFGGVFW